MGLEMWFQEDIENAILAAEEASASTASQFGGNPERVAAFREGYRAALVTIALAFGIRPPERSSLAHHRRTIEGTFNRTPLSKGGKR